MAGRETLLVALKDIFSWKKGNDKESIWGHAMNKKEGTSLYSEDFGFDEKIYEEVEEMSPEIQFVSISRVIMGKKRENIVWPSSTVVDRNCGFTDI